MEGVSEMSLAKVTCQDCGYTWTKNCSLGYEAEKDFYLNYKPRCPSCKLGQGTWKIEEIIEVRMPLSDNERDLFNLAGGTQ